MVYFLVVAVSILLDQATKYLVISNFSLFDVREIVPGFFNLVYVTNKGAAFSFLADVDSPYRHYFFLGIGILACIGLTWTNFSFSAKSKLYSLSLGMIAGGAVGNLIDRVNHGAVIDFLDFYYGSYHWPAFNVADSCICVGVGLFLILNFKTDG